MRARRNRWMPAVAIVLPLVLGMSRTSTPPDDIESVDFEVAVTDRNGSHVMGLERRHFRVFEDNAEQTIASFAMEDRDAAIVLLLEFRDVFGYYDDNVAAPARSVVHALQPKDWAALVKFDVRPEIVVDFTRDRRALLAGLNRMQMPFHRETSLNDAVYFVLDRMESVDERGAIVLVGTGLDTISTHSYTEALRKAEASDARIYAVSVAQFARDVGDPNVDMEWDSRMEGLHADNVLHGLAEATGGLSFYPRFPAGYPAIAAAIGSDLGRGYRLGFVSTDGKPAGKMRKLKVEVVDVDIDRDGKPDKLKVRHKKGYIPRSGKH